MVTEERPEVEQAALFEGDLDALGLYMKAPKITDAACSRRAGGSANQRLAWRGESLRRN